MPTVAELEERIEELDEQLQRFAPQVVALQAQQPKNAFRHKPSDGHHHMMPLRGLDDAVDQGWGFELNAGANMELTRGSWPNNRRLTLRTVGGLMNVDYVVDTTGAGTHTTLASAVAAAITAAGTAGKKTIWLCQSITESDIDIGGLGTSAEITIASHSPYTVVITANANEDIFKQTTAGGNIAGGLHFQSVGLSIPTADYAVLHVNTGDEVRNLTFERCNFDDRYLLRQADATALNNLHLRVKNCTGSLSGFYDIAGTGAGPDSLVALSNDLTMTAFWDAANNQPPQYTMIIGGYYALAGGITIVGGAIEQHFQSLFIDFSPAADLFTTLAASANVQELSFIDITIRFGNASGTFCNLGSAATNNNDGLFFDGIYGYMGSGVGAGGTFVTVDTDWLNVYVGDIYGKDFTTQYSGPATDADALHYHSILRDDDNDTLVQVEESADEDIIRFDVAGAEVMTLDGSRLKLAGIFSNLGAGTELTISAGAVTITRSVHTIDTESDDATDDLTTMNGGSPGDWLIILPAHEDRTVVLKHGAGGTSSVRMEDGQDLPLTEAGDIVLLFRSVLGWYVVGRGTLQARQHDHADAQGGGQVDAAAVTYTPAVATDWDGDADPGDADEALDQLAERIDDAEIAANAAHGISKHTEHANWKVLYTDGSGDEQELALGAVGGVIECQGVAAAPIITVPKRTIVLSASGGTPTTTSGCAAAVRVEAPTNDVDYWVLDFDKDSDEYAFWDGPVMPGNWDGGTLTAVVHWTTASGGAAETVRWAISMIATANDDPIDQAWGTVVNVDDTWIADGDEHISAVSAAITPATSSSRAGGNSLRVRVMRDVSGDDLGGDARLMKVVLEYTTDAHSDS